MASVIERIVSFCAPSDVLTSSEVLQAHRLCMATEDCLLAEVRAFLARHDIDPSMVWYSADSTPLATRQAITLDWAQMRVRHTGKASKDVMVQRCFYQAYDHDMRVLFNAPRMLADKTAWTATECFRSLVQLPLSHGHKGLRLIVLVADRALLRPLEKHVAQILTAERLLLESQIGAEAAQARTALGLFLPSSCVSHDCDGGLRRALAYFCDDKEVLRNSYIVLESLRNSFDISVRFLPGWLRSVVVYEDMPEPWVADVWRLCQSDPRRVEALVDLVVVWHDGKLKVSARHQFDEALLSRLSVAYLETWQFGAFSDSRWVTLGPSMRTRLTSLLLGLEAYIQYCLAQNCSRYYLNGFLRFGAKMKNFVGVVAACSFASDAILALICEDDCLAARINEIDEAAEQEVSYAFKLVPGRLGCHRCDVRSPWRVAQDAEFEGYIGELGRLQLAQPGCPTDAMVVVQWRSRFKLGRGRAGSGAEPALHAPALRPPPGRVPSRALEVVVASWSGTLRSRTSQMSRPMHVHRCCGASAPATRRTHCRAGPSCCRRDRRTRVARISRRWRRSSSA